MVQASAPSTTGAGAPDPHQAGEQHAQRVGAAALADRVGEVPDRLVGHVHRWSRSPRDRRVTSVSRPGEQRRLLDLLAER